MSDNDKSMLKTIGSGLVFGGAAVASSLLAHKAFNRFSRAYKIYKERFANLRSAINKVEDVASEINKMDPAKIKDVLKHINAVSGTINGAGQVTKSITKGTGSVINTIRSNRLKVLGAGAGGAGVGYFISSRLGKDKNVPRGKAKI